MSETPISSGNRLAINRVSPALGAEIRGVDLAAPVDDDLFAAIHDALLAHQVLVFPGQDVTANQQIAFSRRFGLVQIHVLDQFRAENPEIFWISNLDGDGNPTGEHPDPGALVWHTDGSWHRIPGKITLLFGIAVPETGGDTLFANTYAAYDALDPAMQALLDGARAVHDLDYSRRRTPAKDQLTPAQKAEVPPVEHPVVRVHPETGRKTIYLGHHAARIAGMPPAEGEALVAEINRLATRPAFVYRHVWRVGDLVVWDNRCTLHSATPFDAATERRVIRRTTVLGQPRD